ncbi:MAG: hypothetical protein ACR2PY_05485 [Salinispira sp.]
MFPVKDSYTAFLKRHPLAIEKNPQTVNRLAGLMYQLGWDTFMENITEPKETNRQMGPKFSEWLDKKPLGILPVELDEFIANNDNAIPVAILDGVIFIENKNKMYTKLITQYGNRNILSALLLSDFCYSV